MKIARLFRRIADILEPKPQERMLDLKASDVRALRELRALPEWQNYLHLLDAQSTLYGEAMLAAQSIEKMWEMKGHILGLRMAGFLVDEVIRKEQERTENERRRSSNIRADDHRLAALANTPSWPDR